MGGAFGTVCLPLVCKWGASAPSAPPPGSAAYIQHYSMQVESQTVKLNVTSSLPHTSTSLLVQEFQQLKTDNLRLCYCCKTRRLAIANIARVSIHGRLCEIFPRVQFGHQAKFVFFFFQQSSSSYINTYH